MTNHDDGFRDADEARLARRAGELLRESADDLDGATRARLNRARQRALAAAPAGRRDPRRYWVPAAAAAAVAGLAVVLVRAPGPEEPAAGPAPPAVAVAPAPAADLEVLLASSTDDLEMLEDLEFYAWADADATPAELEADLDGVG
jgi:hypothetical protein